MIAFVYSQNVVALLVSRMCSMKMLGRARS
jgi:hypothetical protein